jgi:hypothetical protein
MHKSRRDAGVKTKRILSGGAQSLRILLVVLFLSLPAGAYTRMGSNVRWPVFPVPFYLNSLGSQNTPNGSEFLAIRNSFDTWQKIPTAQISLSCQGFTDIRSAGSDGVNVISFADEDFPFSSGTIAVTLSSWDRTTGAVEDADIVFNPALPFTTSGEEGAYDIQSVATHEIGHFLGLDHTAIVSATMNPYGTTDSTFQRVLRSDDILGISSIYPAASVGGSVSGTVTLNGVALFGAHVVAVNSVGNSVASTLTARNGAYQIQNLPSETYRLYAEPLDGPVTEDNFISGSGMFTFDTSFTTTFCGDTLVPANGRVLQVSDGTQLGGVNIHALASQPGAVNLTSPALGILASPGDSGTISLRGDSIESGVTFSSLDPSITFQSPTFPSANSAQVRVNINLYTASGLKTIFAQKSGSLSALSGGLVVADYWPEIYTVTPESGPRDGGTKITVAGSNFVQGMTAALGGIPLENVVIKGGTVIEATTPANGGGVFNLQVVSPLGLDATKFEAFTYVWPPITLDNISPSSGPPGTLVTITGTNFDLRPANNQVVFNGLSASVVSATSAQLQVIVPFGTSSGAVTVTTFGQTAQYAQFTITAPPPSSNHPPLTYQFLDATESAGGTRVPFPEATKETNDISLQVTLPFTFNLFTSTFLEGSKFSVTNNGWLSLHGNLGGDAEWENTPLPASSVVRPDGGIGSIAASLVAPYFDDLIQDLPGGGVFTRVVGTAPNRQLIIQWKDSRRVDDNGDSIDGRITFETILYEGSNDIAFLYQTLEGVAAKGESQTVGIQNASRDRAVQFSHNQTRLFPGLMLVFRFNPMEGTYQLSSNEPRQYIPFVIDTLAFRTNLGITNASGQEAKVKLSLFDEMGFEIGGKSDVVPANGLKQFNNVVRSLLALDPNFITNEYGSVLVTSDQPVVAYSTQIENKSNDPSLLVGSLEGKLDLLIPSTTSVNQFRSTLVLQNTGTVVANVLLRQRDQNGAVKAELNVFVSPKGFWERINLHDALGLTGVYGPLEIHSLNQVPLVATSRVYAVDSGTSGFFEGVNTELVVKEGILPITLDNAAFRTNLGIVNLSGTEATVEVRFYVAGGQVLGTKTVKVPPRGLFQQNVFRLFGATVTFADVPGYLWLTSDQPLAGFTSLINNSGDDPSLSQLSNGGAKRLLIPSSTNVNPFRSSLVLINLGSAQAPVKISVRDTNGALLAEDSTQVIPPRGFYQVDDLLTALKISSNYGPLEILSLNDMPLAAVSRVSSTTQNTSGFFSARFF